MIDTLLLAGESLLLSRPQGTLDRGLAMRLLELIEQQENQAGEGFNRFCDLTQIRGIHLTVEDVEACASRRRKSLPDQVRIKSAFLVGNPLAYGIVHLYRALVDPKHLQIRIFTTRERAAQWLDVDAARLEW